MHSDARNDRAERCGNADVAVVGNLGLAPVLVRVHLGLEGLLQLTRSSAKVDDPLALAHVLHRKTLRLKPGFHLGDVGVMYAKARAEVFRL